MAARPGSAAALGALAIVAVADGWRTAVLAGLAAAAVAATRVRFAARAALCLLALAALLALGGWGPGFDQRPAKPPAAGHAAAKERR